MDADIVSNKIHAEDFDVNNLEYLKQFVEEHPNNKMAWYLLGKEYEAKGQDSKANYCYNQAGSVYEAFEASKVPAELLREYQERLLLESRRKEKHNKMIRKIGAALALLLLVWIPFTYAPGWINDETDELVPMEISDISQEDPTFTAMVYAEGSGLQFMAELTDQSAGSGGNRSIEPDGTTIILGMNSVEHWSIWSKEMPIVYEIGQNSDSGMTRVQSYDPIACECTPPNSSTLKGEAEKWMIRQESLAVLGTSIRNYKEKTGKWPKSLSDLTKSYPDNWLSGNNNIMKRDFDALLAKLQNGNKKELGDDVNSSSGESLNSESTLGKQEPYFTEPLKVLVDRDTHRLAVVSGDVILRSYKVGLGGDSTPEGNFKISEKVVNPNGRSNGEFGSRGMQLSETNYAIHGTDDPESIGKDESLGCIRMLKEDVEELFDLVPKGTTVTIGKGIVPTLEVTPKQRFALSNRQNQSNPDRVYRWLN